jgi:hypothetical protein
VVKVVKLSQSSQSRKEVLHEGGKKKGGEEARHAQNHVISQ